MPDYIYSLRITTDTEENALTVLRERLCCDEDYGFEYDIEYDERQHTGFPRYGGDAATPSLLRRSSEGTRP